MAFLCLGGGPLPLVRCHRAPPTTPHTQRNTHRECINTAQRMSSCWRVRFCHTRSVKPASVSLHPGPESGLFQAFFCGFWFWFVLNSEDSLLIKRLDRRLTADACWDMFCLQCGEWPVGKRTRFWWWRNIKLKVLKIQEDKKKKNPVTEFDLQGKKLIFSFLKIVYFGLSFYFESCSSENNSFKLIFLLRMLFSFFFKDSPNHRYNCNNTSAAQFQSF